MAPANDASAQIPSLVITRIILLRRPQCFVRGPVPHI